MGYNSHFTGEITIDPPLIWQEILGLAFREPEEDYGTLRLVIEKVKEQTPEGTLVRKTANTIEPGSEDEFKGYDALEVLQRYVDALPDHTFSGYILREGEDSGDIARMIVKDGKAIEQRASFTFSDE